MSDAPEKKSDKNLFIAIGILLVIFIGGGIITAPEREKWDVEKQYDGAVDDSDVKDDGAQAESNTVLEPSADFDLAFAKRERILGDRSAPIKISEHSSFTCGHCGTFHKEIFAQFKAEYIDTGKAYLVFSDFPLNAPALHASKVGRCVSDEGYFGFVDKLFQEQADWAYDAKYLDYLKNTAAEFGVDENLFETCVQSKELQEAMLDRMRAVQAQWEVSSTPSFVINNQKTITGAKTYEDFDEAIQAALSEIGTETVTEDVVEEAPAEEVVEETMQEATEEAPEEITEEVSEEVTNVIEETAEELTPEVAAEPETQKQE